MVPEATDDSPSPSPVTGVYAALATPRRANSLDAEAAVLLEYLDAVVKAGVDGLVLFGSTGEFVHFDAAERMRVLALAIRRSRVPVLVNVSHSTLAGAVQLAQNAIDAGAAGLLLMPPYFYRYGGAQIAAFYDAFRQALDTSIPLYLYNLPMYAQSIPPDLTERLLRSGAFAGIKDSTTDWTVFQPLIEMRASVPFTLFVGNEVLYLKARQSGADGTISGVAAAIPELLVALDRAIRERETDRAIHLNSRLADFVAYVNRLPATVAIRQAGIARGWRLGPSAIPFDPETNATFTEFQRWLDNWFPQTLSECAAASAAAVRT